MTRGRIIALLTFAALAVATARGEVEFTGILVTSEQTLFTLSEPSAAKSGWLQLGQSFAGYDLTSYDAKSDTLTLTKAGLRTRVRLKDEKVKAARVELGGTFTLGAGEKMSVVRATLTLGEETVFPLKDGLVFHVTPQSRPDGSILYRAFFERPLADHTMEKLSAPSVIVRPGAQFSITAGEYGFSFTPATP